MLKILGLLFLFSFSLQANEAFDDLIEEIIPKSELSNAQLKALRQELKIQNIFIQGVKSIELQGGEFKNITQASNTIQDLYIKSIGAKAESLPSAIKNEITDSVKTSINQRSVRSVLQKSKDFALNKLNAQKVMLTSLTRRVGMDVGLVYFLSLQVDLTFPMIMVSLGHVEFAPLLVTPVSSTVTAAYTGIKSAVKFRHLLKHLGGFANAKALFKIYRDMRSFFNLKIFPQHDLLNLNIQGKQVVFTVERKTLLNKFLTKLGFNQNLNYENLSKFLRENDVLSEFLNRLDTLDRPNEVKMIRVLNKIELLQDEKLIASLKDRFGKFINELDNIPNYQQARAWVSKISTTTNFEDFSRLLTQMPDDIPPKTFDRLWREVILPDASKNIGPYFNKDTFKAFRNLGTEWDKELRRLSATSNEIYISDELRTKLNNYFFNSLAPVNGCSAIYQMKGSMNTPLFF